MAERQERMRRLPRVCRNSHNAAPPRLGLLRCDSVGPVPRIPPAAHRQDDRGWQPPPPQQPRQVSRPECIGLAPARPGGC